MKKIVLCVFIITCSRNIISLEEREKIFSTIFQNNSWSERFNVSETVSGHGSTLTATTKIRSDIEYLLKKLNVSIFIDAPCGDFNWMRCVDLSSIRQYIGIDIVSDIIVNNQKRYSNDKILFLHADIISKSLPKADLILCRDCFVHLPYNDIFAAIKNMKKSGITYLLTTTYTMHKVNRNIFKAGGWRQLNLQNPPFNFPAPLMLIAEHSDSRPGHTDKSLGLWLLADLEI